MYFSELASYFQKIEETRSRNLITEILAHLFRKSTGDEIGNMCYLLQGRVVPLYEAVEFGIADKFMIRAIAKAYHVDGERVLREFKKAGDLGIAAEHCYHALEQDNKKGISVTVVFERLYELAKEGGVGSQEKKIDILAQLLQQVDSLSARYLARIPLDKLRLGFSDMTILDGLSWMIHDNKSLRTKLESAYNVRPDIGYIAKTIKEKGIEGLKHVKAVVGAPILAALCQRIPNADEMIKKMGEVAVEPKYDGARVQIHYKNGDVRTFSRNLENTTAMFPELDGLTKELRASEAILDCEAIGMDSKTGKFISFQHTMTRKRKYNIDEALLAVPLKFVVFDLLYKDGKDLLALPLSQRRHELERTINPKKLLFLSPHIVTSDASVIRRYHDEQLIKGLEGAVVKKWDGKYEPGRRGFNWVKFKEEEGKTGKLTDTIDAVIMGYTSGQGKRTQFGIGQVLLGVRDKDEFVTVSKLGSGATEDELTDFFNTLKPLRVKQQPKEYKKVNKIYMPDVWVIPKIVLEIAGDDLTKSPAHGAGYGVRFPRLVRIRTDKSPEQATTVSEVKRMYDAQ